MLKGLKFLLMIGMLISSNALIQTNSYKYVKRSLNGFPLFMDECIVGNKSIGCFNPNLKFICQVACSNLERHGSGCEAVQIKDDGKMCVFYSSLMVSETPGLVANLDSFYYRTNLQTNGRVDVARGKSTAGTTTYTSYIGPASVVSGSACNKGVSGCWCGSGHDKPLYINLGQVYNIKKMFITSSQNWPDYSNDSQIYIGSAGTTADPLFGVFNRPANSYTNELLGDATGQYITIFRKWSTVCLCTVEAYEN